MRQLHTTYKDHPNLLQLVREIPWGHNIMIMTKIKDPQEQVFYGAVAKQPKFSGISEIQLKLVNIDRKQAHFHRFLWKVGLNCDF